MALLQLSKVRLSALLGLLITGVIGTAVCLLLDGRVWLRSGRPGFAEPKVVDLVIGVAIAVVLGRAVAVLTWFVLPCHCWSRPVSAF